MNNNLKKCLWGPESGWWWVGILGTNLRFINLWRLQEMMSRTHGMGRWPSRAMADPSQRIVGKGLASGSSCRGLFWVWWCKWAEWIVMEIWLQANGRPQWLLGDLTLGITRTPDYRIVGKNKPRPHSQATDMDWGWGGGGGAGRHCTVAEFWLLALGSRRRACLPTSLIITRFV